MTTRRGPARRVAARLVPALLLAALGGTLPAKALAQSTSPDPPDTAAPSQDEPGRGPWRFGEYPSLRVGDALRVDFRARFQADRRTFSPEHDDPPDTGELALARVGVEGWLFRRLVEFEVSRDMDDDDRPWADVFVNLRPFDAAQLQAGKFKVPFGRDRLTGATRLDFVQRALVSRSLVPGRDVGGMAHGRLARRAVEYAAGYFRGDPDGALEDRGVDADTDAGSVGIDPTQRMWATRVVVRPFRFAGIRDWREDVEIGTAAIGADLPEGLFGVRGRSAFDETFFRRVHVAGTRRGFGIDGSVVAGVFSVKGEFVRIADARLAQGVDDGDLPDLVGRGWWLAGTWVLTGERKRDVESPRRPVLQGGFGALEIATRLERLRFGSAETRGQEPSYSPRAVNVAPNADTAWTIGVNWYVNRWVKVQANALRERFSDAARTPADDRDTFWSALFRAQFAM